MISVIEFHGKIAITKETAGTYVPAVLSPNGKGDVSIRAPAQIWGRQSGSKFSNRPLCTCRSTEHKINEFIAQVVKVSGVRPEQMPYSPDLDAIKSQCETS